MQIKKKLENLALLGCDWRKTTLMGLVVKHKQSFICRHFSNAQNYTTFVEALCAVYKKASIRF